MATPSTTSATCSFRLRPSASPPTSGVATSGASESPGGAARKAIYSEAYRAPSWQESAGAGYFFLPSHDLRPETVRSAEVVLDQRLGSHHLLFSAFRSWWKDLVEPHVLSVDEVFAAQLRG